MGREEGREWERACRGRARGAGSMWGKDAEEQGLDERLREKENKRAS